jgi:diguanylate cyclase (GGDEF)-like protein
MPGSILSYLVCLAIVPLICLVLVAAVPVRDVMRAVQVNTSIGYVMERVRLLDAIRLAVIAETTSATSEALGIRPESMSPTSGGRPVVQPLSQASATTDTLIGRLAAVPMSADVAGALARRLAATRSQVGLPVAAASAAVLMSTSSRIVRSYSASLLAVARAEKSAASTVLNGALGGAVGSLLRWTYQLELVADLVIRETQRVPLVYQAIASPLGPSTAQLLAIRDQTVLTRSVLADLRQNSAGPQATPFERFRVAGSTTHFTVMVDRLLARGTSGPRPGMATVVTFGRTIDTYSHEQNQLLIATVEGGLAATKDFRSQSVAHARQVVIGAVVSVGLTTVLLVLIGGAIRRRLRLLANAARRLSSGHLDPVVLLGPREVELAGRGLDDAATSLRRVLDSAEMLAEGDLDAPALARPIEGRLGRAVHASVQQVARAMEQRAALQEELAYRATHDGLTGLANRAAAEQALRDALARDRYDGGRTGVLFIDLDHFKAVNDRHGHAAGDYVLRVAADRMATEIRSSDLLCRLGGDEFIVVAHDVADLTWLVGLGRRIVAHLARPVPWQGVHLQIGACAGIVLSEEGDDADTLLLRADRSVYRAKAGGRGKISL